MLLQPDSPGAKPEVTESPRFRDVVFLSCVLYPLVQAMFCMPVLALDGSESSLWLQAIGIWAISFAFACFLYLPAAGLAYVWLMNPAEGSAALGRKKATALCGLVGYLACSCLYSVIVIWMTEGGAMLLGTLAVFGWCGVVYLVSLLLYGIALNRVRHLRAVKMNAAEMRA